jgi:hypothetical protein
MHCSHKSPNWLLDTADLANWTSFVTAVRADQVWNTIQSHKNKVSQLLLFKLGVSINPFLLTKSATLQNKGTKCSFYLHRFQLQLQVPWLYFMCFLEASISSSILDMAQPTSHIPFKKDETQIMIFTRLLRLTPLVHLNFPSERWALSHYCSQGFLTLMSWISWSDKRKWCMLSCLPNNTATFCHLILILQSHVSGGKKMKAMLGNEQLYGIAIFMILYMVQNLTG